MTSNIKYLILASTLFAIFLSLGVLSWAYLNYRQAQNIVNPQRIISFSAQGKVYAKPDIIRVSFSVITQSEKAETVQSENDKKAKELIAFVKAEGVSQDDIKTINYSLNPQYDYTWCRKGEKDYRSCPPKIIGYELTQTIEIKIRDFSKINEIIGGLTEKGANQISDINFEIDDVEDYKNQARIEALNKIEKRAKLVSEKTSLKLGKIISVSENEIGPIYRTMKANAFEAGASEAAPQAQIEPGTNEISVTLTVSYEIK